MAQVPFADGGRGVALCLEAFSESNFTLREPAGAIWEEYSSLVATHTTAHGQPAGKKTCPAGSTHT